MKIIHISDLHLGKRVNEFSMLEDQTYILNSILSVATDEKPKALVIAGDVYDKQVPPADAIELFDAFLYALFKLGIQVFIISGNHDSAERLSFASRLISGSGIFIAPTYNGNIECVTLNDEFGPVDFYMLPFVKPVHVRRFYPDSEITSYTDALSTVVGSLDLSKDTSRRSVLITHQFVTGAQRSDSEEISVGGTDNVDGRIFDAFDYVALGHIHMPQQLTPRMRYCGTPLKYSFSEALHEKSVTIAEIGAKAGAHAELSIRTVPLVPLHDMREIKGSYEELTLKANYENTDLQDYLHITLTDEEDVFDAVRKLKLIYPNLMKLDYDNTRTRAGISSSSAAAPEKRTPIDLFADFYEERNGKPMSDFQKEKTESIIEKISEETI